MTFELIFVVLASHLVADFIFQKHEWAANKSSSNMVLTKHVATYTGLMWFFMVPFLGILNAFYFASINGCAHWCTDYVTSRITKKLWAEKRVHEFFVVIGTDQLIHYCCLFYLLEKML